VSAASAPLGLSSHVRCAGVGNASGTIRAQAHGGQLPGALEAPAPLQKLANTEKYDA